jgi:DNA-binding transcriptional regulator GbsR (MarR family)
MNNFLYNPDQKSKEEIIAGFVVRQEVYEEIMLDLEGSRMEHPEQHYLIVGQRGMGKTTLLLRLKYGIEDSPALRHRLIPVAFTEEQYQISELTNLWEYIGEYLQDNHGFGQLYTDMEKNATSADFEERAYELLNAALTKRGSKIVLLIDNMGDLLYKLENQEVHRLREILQTNSHIRIIGGATSYMEDFLDYHQPFYEFFKTIRLDGLDKGEMTGLILKLGELHGKEEKIRQILKEAPGRIETMRILTGGVPRTISILFGIFLDHEHDHAIKDLYRVLDLVTPLYKHRMDDLPKQQQKIVDALARYWEPMTVKELTLKTRLISKTLSAQLNQLEREQIVIKNSTGTKNKTYLVRERFWNIWYLMRYGKKGDKEKIIWLVKFLEAWLSDDDLKERINSFVDRVKKSDIDEDQLKLFSKVYVSLSILSADNKLKLKSIEKEIKEEIQMSDDDWYHCAQEAYLQQSYYDSLKHILKVKEWTKAEHISFLLNLSNQDLSKFITNIPGEILSEEEISKYMWALTVMEVYARLIKWTKPTINHEDNIQFLNQYFKRLILANMSQQSNGVELLLLIYLTCQFLKKLISAGLYHAVFKSVEEAEISINATTIFLKDQWKPFYIALKYLYLPEELSKQPSELRDAALPLVDLLVNANDNGKAS